MGDFERPRPVFPKALRVWAGLLASPSFVALMGNGVISYIYIYMPPRGL